MNNVVFLPDNPEYTSACQCCNKPLHAGCGGIHVDGKEVGGYWYQWAEAHQGTFDFAISWQSSDETFVATAWARPAEGGIHYGPHRIEESPWGNMSDYGTHLDRDQLLQHADASLFWQYTDLLSSKEPHLAPRIKAHFGLS